MGEGRIISKFKGTISLGNNEVIGKLWGRDFGGKLPADKFDLGLVKVNVVML